MKPTSLTGDVTSEIAEDDWEKGCFLSHTHQKKKMRNRGKINSCLGASEFYKSLYVVVEFMLILAVFLLCAKNGLFSLMIKGNLV